MSLIGPEASKQLKVAARFASAGFELVLAILVGYFGGRWLDATYETGQVLQYVGLALGIFAGFRSLFTLARDAQGALEETDDSQPDEATQNEDEHDPDAER